MLMYMGLGHIPTYVISSLAGHNLFLSGIHLLTGKGPLDHGNMGCLWYSLKVRTLVDSI